MSRWAPALALAFLFACSCGSSDPETSADAVADARALAEILDSDATGPALDDAVRAADTRRPVMAAGILTNSAIPAMRLQLERIEALHPTSVDGRTLRTRALGVHRARLVALEHYRDALSRGEVDDDVLLDALHEASVSERDLLTLRDDLSAHAPRAPANSIPSGLPPITEAHTDDGDTTEEPDGVEPDPGVVEDALPEM